MGTDPNLKSSDGSRGERWTQTAAEALYQLSFNDLLFKAHSIHRTIFDPNEIQLSRLLNIKTGGCPEDCGYCSQSAHHAPGLKASRLMGPAEVIKEARKARDGGATRYCMGAAWRSPKPRDEAAIVEMIKGAKSAGLETCMTLGMLSAGQARTFAEAGLDFYNHNLDTSRRFYPEVVSTRTFDDRLKTLAHVTAAGIAVCCGGILGLGESVDDRIALMVTLANLPRPPDSVPINMLVPIEGTRLGGERRVDPIDFVRIIALARLMMPQSLIRLAAGRLGMSDELQALCFYAGANSIFVGDALLTTANPGDDEDAKLLRRLGMKPAVQARNA